MLVLRIIGFIVVIAIGCSLAIGLLRKDARYVRLAWQIFKYALVLVAIVLIFMILERLVLVI